MMTSKTAQNAGTLKHESFMTECIVKPMVNEASIETS